MNGVGKKKRNGRKILVRKKKNQNICKKRKMNRKIEKHNDITETT